jgi:predicted dehydrogenase
MALVGIDHPHGSGWRDLLTNLDDRIEIAAIVPRFGGRTTSLEERYAVVPRYDTVDDLIASAKFDGALVTLPNNESPQAAAALAQAGKHILLEKPGAADAAAAERIAAAVGDTGVAFQAGYMWRYDEAANRLRNMVRDGRFGKLVSVEMTFVTSDTRRRDPSHYLFDRDVSGGGFFNWLACHYLDLLMYVTGEAIVGVTARTGVFAGEAIDVEDGGVAILDLAGGGIATFIGGYWIPRWTGEAHWCIRGTERWVHWDPNVPGTGGVLDVHGPKPQWYATEERFSVAEDTTTGYGGASGVRLVEDWLDAAAAGRECRNTAVSSVSVLRLIGAIEQSSAEGRRVDCQIGQGGD